MSRALSDVLSPLSGRFARGGATTSAALGLLLLVAGGCAGAQRGGALVVRPVTAGDVVVELHFNEGAAADGVRVGEAIAPALVEVAKRWGTLREPARVEVLPDHAALEEAVDKPGFAWLRAWARFDVIYVQAPSTWGLLQGTDDALHELLVHELTHLAMYQRAATPATWQRKKIPLWFREGMASVTAAQGYRRAGLKELARWLAAHPGEDPVSAPEALYRSDSGAVYAAAHHTYEFLESRYGLAAVRALLDRMRADSERFPGSFEAVIGLSPEEFEAEFLRYVAWGGFESRSRPAGEAAR